MMSDDDDQSLNALPYAIFAATEDDLDDVFRIEKQFGVNAFSRGDFKGVLKKPCRIFNVIVNINEVVGYYILKWRRNTRVGWLYSIAVDLDHHRKGFGGMMLLDAIEESWWMGFKRLKLEVSDINPGAYQLYKKHGFVDTGFVDSYYPDGSNAIKMELKLRDS